MSKQHRAMLLYCESSIHMGAGTGSGTIDLPIQRERHTGFPKAESSSLRGAIRETVTKLIEGTEKDKFNRIFGNKNDGSVKSCIEFSEARLLFFPVRSYKGVFAYVTCPMVLKRFARDLSTWNINDASTIAFNPSELPEDNEILYPNDDSAILIEDKIILEEYLFNAKKCEVTLNDEDLIAQIQSLLGDDTTTLPLDKQVAIVSDTVFRDMTELYTEKITRNKIDSKTGTVDTKIGGLFNEEYLPSESILYAYVGAAPEFTTKKNEGGFEKIKAADAMEFFIDKMAKTSVLQMGGDQGIGKGWVKHSIFKSLKLDNEPIKTENHEH